jgi:ribose/xylose/arabinose/galactoside ABC-type transport system permease subunit
VFVALVAMLVLGMLVDAANFLTLNNLIRVLRGAAVVAVVGYGMSLLMITAEFDLSVGSLVGITAGLGAVMISNGFDPVFTILLTVTLAVLYGITQGFLVTKFGLPSLIVTIGTLTLLRGAHFLLLGGSAVTISTAEAGPVLKAIGGTYRLPFPVAIPFTDATLFTIPAIRYSVPGIHDQTQIFQSFPAQIVWVVVFLAVFHHILFRTTFGQHVRATGDNINSVETTGVDPDRIKIAGFAIIAAITAFAGLSQLAYIGSVSPGTGSGTELIVIAAVVLGGTKLTGGDGSMTGVLMGALVLGFAQNILTLGGFGPKFSRLITGLFIIVAIGLDTVFKEFTRDLLTDWYTAPIGGILSGPGEFFRERASDKSPDQALAFLFSSVFVTAILVTIGMFLPALVGAIGGLTGSGGLQELGTTFSERFTLYIAEANIEGAVMVLLQLYLVVLLFAVLALATIQFAGSRFVGHLDVDDTIVVVSYGMAPMPLLAIPLLLSGFGFLQALIFATLAVAVLAVGWMLSRGLTEHQRLSRRDSLLTVGATLAVWLVVALYFGANLAA